jgi:hypothetical protein
MKQMAQRAANANAVGRCGEPLHGTGGSVAAGHCREHTGFTEGKRMDGLVARSSRSRVPDSTAEEINERLREAAAARVSHFAEHPELIEGRLQELDREWDIERAIEANAATLMLTGLALGAKGDRRWLSLSGMVAAFLLQHAVQGWCPPVPILRRLGFRTMAEIEQERRALKMLRVSGTSESTVAAAVHAVRSG